MKKMNKKGFMLTETLIVSVMIITVLLVLYVQFKNVSKNFEDTFNYDSIGSSYNLYNAKLYIEQSNYSLLASKLTNEEYVDITNCPNGVFSNTEYCTSLFSNLEIKQLLITNENLTNLINNNDFDVELNSYMKTIKYDIAPGYRLIASFKDGTYASIKVLNDESFAYQIDNSCNNSIEVDYTIHHVLETYDDNGSPSGYEYKSDTTGKGPCGSTITVADSVYNEDECIYVSQKDHETIDLVLDSDSNEATIYYKRVQVDVEIGYFIGDTDTLIPGVEETTVTTFCGLKIYPEEYKKNISGYTFVRVRDGIDNIYTVDGAANQLIHLEYRAN